MEVSPIWNRHPGVHHGYVILHRMVNEVVMDFEAYQVMVDEKGAELFERKDEEPGFTSNLLDAFCYCHGHVKFDGCSNVDFGDQDRGCMLHFCGMHDVKELACMFEIVYELAREQLGEDCLF